MIWKPQIRFMLSTTSGAQSTANQKVMRSK